jgi:TetR/AcrR family tetracycline transcriptional repressor
VTEAPLSRAAVVAAALDILNEAGLEQVSLRKVAERLGVKAPSLYWYVEDKAALYALMSESVFRSCLDAMPACADWRSWLRAFGRALWDAQMKTRDAAKLIIVGGMHEEQLRAIVDDLAEQLGRYGIDRETATTVQSSAQALITGWAAFQQSPNAPFLNSIMDVEEEVMRSLDALAEGLADRIEAASKPKQSAVHK